jgi:dienelactone hydrolase
MPESDLLKNVDLADFEPRSIEIEGITKTVHVIGNGPGIIILAEMPGISPHLVRFARWVRDAGFSVYMPSLFGRDGVVGTATEGIDLFRRLCVRTEFRALRGGESSPVTGWLRGLAKIVHTERGGLGVGVIGMCFTGNFALSMMLEPAVIVSVMSQPSLPILEPGNLEISSEDLTQIRARLDREDLRIMGLRFEGDQICRRERFDAYEQALGDRFVNITLPDSAAGNEQIPPFFSKHVSFPHSVLTIHLVDEEGSPTSIARDQVLGFLGSKLLPTTSNTSKVTT